MDHGGDNEIELDINERNFSNMEDKLLHMQVTTHTYQWKNKVEMCNNRGNI